MPEERWAVAWEVSVSENDVFSFLLRKTIVIVDTHSHVYISNLVTSRSS